MKPKYKIGDLRIIGQNIDHVMYDRGTSERNKTRERTYKSNMRAIRKIKWYEFKTRIKLFFRRFR